MFGVIVCVTSDAGVRCAGVWIGYLTLALKGCSVIVLSISDFV